MEQSAPGPDDADADLAGPPAETAVPAGLPPAVLTMSPEVEVRLPPPAHPSQKDPESMSCWSEFAAPEITPSAAPINSVIAALSVRCKDTLERETWSNRTVPPQQQHAMG